MTLTVGSVRVRHPCCTQMYARNAAIAAASGEAS